MIEIKELYKSFGDKPVLSGINVTIGDGDIYGLVGISGAGKSTLLRCINGLETFERGTLRVNGTDISSLHGAELRKFRSGIGMIFQQFSLLERKTVYENIMFPMKCYNYKKAEADARIHELLRLVELTDKIRSRPSQLSGGQKQRVAIARALAMNPKILLCDEATSALDPNITKSILALLKKINRELGITIVIVTHQMEVVKEVCTDMALLSKGELQISGSVQDIFLGRSETLAELLGSAGMGQQGDKVVFEMVQRPGQNDLLSRFATATGIRFEVVWGGLDRYADSIAGAFTLAVDKDDFPKAQAFLEDTDTEWRRV
ncbi:methionine ABC transporter ATP-binding protein [Paenibacillus riograndensis]|uniref:Methionine import ATP-binding protein MetN n=1 Tax=Paenibacillus riograndensis SBR5 TaxID=1073571 RepID=A0A0E4CUR0_9BACL|nr:ATP-binding cassette domain-containing protein [Paenibacillus riograndensis]CQR52658.1 Methionine import ATP-binding protein MetN [Paenibacillus riograndensis SBR5]